MRSTVKVLSAVAALAMAAGLSACDEQDIAQPSSDGATASSPTKEDSGSTASSDSTSSKDSKSSKGSEDKDGETTKSGSKIQEIKPVTFKDEQISLTQTCDKAIEDYAAPKFKQSSGSGTVYLLHCTLEFSGDIGYSSTLSDSTSLQDKGDSSLKADEYGSLLEDDMKDDGLKVLGSDDRGSRKVEGWFAFASVGETTKLKPFSEGTTTIVYDREDGESSQTGKQYPAYSDTQDLVLK
ncbi:MAG: hypothetical protein ACFNXT_09605 [Actinomyces massiliensis]